MGKAKWREKVSDRECQHGRGCTCSYCEAARIALAAAEWRDHYRQDPPGWDPVGQMMQMLNAILRGEGPERFPPEVPGGK